ncbi:hypothetical protein GPALN_005555 [Globodera pallida]|nr:hypothetical protein GPALN_005555 [Globodera pallida]
MHVNSEVHIRKNSHKTIPTPPRRSQTTTPIAEHRTHRHEEMSRSDRILNSLIEDVHHRTSVGFATVRLNLRKVRSGESSVENDEENMKKFKRHKKEKKQKKKKEHKSKKKDHRSPKQRKERNEEKRIKRKNRKHSKSEEHETDVGNNCTEQIGFGETKKDRSRAVVIDEDELPAGADFQLFGHEKGSWATNSGKECFLAKANALKMRRNECNDASESDSEENQRPFSEEQSVASFPLKKQSTLANILASAPQSFPWLTALGKQKQSEKDFGGETERNGKKIEGKAEQSEKKEVGGVTEHSEKEIGVKTKESGNEKGVGEEKEQSEKKGKDKAAKRIKRKSRHHRSSRRRHHSNRSRSQTYSASPERSHCHEKTRHHRIDKPSVSPSPLPTFSRHRALDTRRKLIEESWHRRIEHSIRPCEVPEKRRSSNDTTGGSELIKSDYMDENGRIDKQKLLDIATRNATRLAMEGKLPKGAELTETIKNKSVDQLVDLCKKLQSDRSLVLKRHGRGGSSCSDLDEDGEYSRKYERWRRERERREDKEFQNRAVRPAGEPARISCREQREIVRHEENTLRLTYPVSSGVQHRTKANMPISKESSAGALVRFGDIGPLTTALAKVRTNILTAYKPLSKPLALSQPSSTLSSNSQNTSQVEIGPQLPSTSQCQSNKPLYPGFVPAKTLDCVNANAYEIALAASARKKDAENSDKTTASNEPMTVTSAQFIGPVVPNSAVDAVLNASLLLCSESAPNSNCPSVASPSTISKPVFSSSWDRPGHIAAREALLRKVAEQKRKTEESAKVTETQLLQQSKIVPSTSAQICENTSQNLAPSSCSQLSATSSSLASPTPEIEPILPSTPQCHEAPAKSIIEPKTNADGFFKKPALPSVKQKFVPSGFGAPMLLPTTKNTSQNELFNSPQAATNDDKDGEKTTGMALQGKDFLDRFHTFVEAQVIRQKAESALQATILTTHLQQKQSVFKDESASFYSSSSHSNAMSMLSSRPDPVGLTRPQKSIQELVGERLRYSRRLQRDPNDYESRKALARVEKEMNSWAQDSSLPGEFTGHTGARVLSEKELEPSDPRFHAWAKKDQFRTAPEICSGVGLRLLQRMGWQPGQGLGRDRAGQLEPLALDVKADRKGLFSSFERAPTRECVLDSTGKNPISVLMEQCARHRWRNPEFSCAESGPQNSKRYHWKAVLNGVEYAPSLPSSNKRAGKAQVCMVILEALGLTSNSM